MASLVDYVFQVKNKPELDSAGFKFTYVNGAAVNGDLSAPGSKTVILTPVPQGVNGTNLYHYLYVTGGAGTPEAVLVTGGTAVSGAPTGTITFTTANAHTGLWQLTSATGGVQEAVNALSENGGMVKLPAGNVGLYQTLTIGNGTPILRSMRNSISIVGQGSGRSIDVAFPNTAATALVWLGPIGGTMVRMAGPVGNCTLEGFQMEAAGAANMCLDIAHSYSCTYRDLNLAQWASIGLRSMATDFNFALMVTGNNNNHFENVVVSAGFGGSGQIAAQFGQSIPNSNSIYDFASNNFVGCSFVGGAGIGMELRFADNCAFFLTNFSGSTAAVKFTDPGNRFPASNVFVQSPVGGPLASSAGFLPVNPNFFFPLTTGEFAQDLGSLIGFAAGIDSSGIWFGRMKNAPLTYASASNPAAIANTVAQAAFSHSYTVRAHALDFVGAQLRIRAAGRLSTTGTPTLTLRFKLGTLEVGRFPFTTFNNSSFQPFSVDVSMGVSVAGALGNLLMGPAIAIIGGANARTSEITGSQALDFTAAAVLTMTAQWGSADPANTITLDNLTAEITYPELVQ